MGQKTGGGWPVCVWTWGRAEGRARGKARGRKGGGHGEARDVAPWEEGGGRGQQDQEDPPERLDGGVDRRRLVMDRGRDDENVSHENNGWSLATEVT